MVATWYTVLANLGQQWSLDWYVSKFVKNGHRLDTITRNTGNNYHQRIFLHKKLGALSVSDKCRVAAAIVLTDENVMSEHTFDVQNCLIRKLLEKLSNVLDWSFETLLLNGLEILSKNFRMRLKTWLTLKNHRGSAAISSCERLNGTKWIKECFQFLPRWDLAVTVVRIVQK